MGYCNHRRLKLGIGAKQPTEQKLNAGDHSTPQACRRAIFRLTDAETAEDFGVVLTELGGDIAHLHTLTDPDRGADVRHLAEFRVTGILHEPAVADLRVGEHLRLIVDWAHGARVASSTSTQSLVVLVVSTAFITSSSASRFSMRA
jgi:hypothetical protein